MREVGKDKKKGRDIRWINKEKRVKKRNRVKQRAGEESDILWDRRMEGLKEKSGISLKATGQ